MSKIPYRFLPVPYFLIDKGWTDDPKTWRLIRCLFRRTHAEGHIIYPNGKELYLEPFEFMFGRDSVCKETGLSDAEVRDRMAKFATSKITTKITGKSTSKYTVHRWMTECFEENWHQQNNHQNVGKTTGKSTSITTSIPTSRATSNTTTTKNEEAKIPDVASTFVRSHANDTFNSSGEGSLTSFPRIQLPAYIEEALEASKQAGLSKVIDMFLFSDGSAVHPKVMKRWISWYTEETVVIAMIFMLEKERRAKAKGRSITKPEAYLEKILSNCLWETEEIQKAAKIIDLNQAKRHKRI